MLAFSSAPSCQPPFSVGKRLALSSLNNSTSATGEISPSPITHHVQHRLFCHRPIDTARISSRDILQAEQTLYKHFDPGSSRQAQSNACRFQHRINKPDKMDATYPADLIASDCLPMSQILHRTPIQLHSVAANKANGTSSAEYPIERCEKRRSKRYNQPAGRYRTTPITLEEIREVDEELCAKQQSAQNDEQQQDETNHSGLNGRRTSPYTWGQRKHLSSSPLDFRCTYLTKTKLLPSRSLWPNNFSSSVYRHRSQESVLHPGIQPLPTIPEEWRQQYQQQKTTNCVSKEVDTAANADPTGKVLEPVRPQEQDVQMASLTPELVDDLQTLHNVQTAKPDCDVRRNAGVEEA